MTTNGISPPTWIAIPQPPAGWFDVAYTVTPDGHLASLRSDFDVVSARRTDRAAWVVPRIAQGRLQVFDGVREGAPVSFAMDVAYPRFDRLPDGRWVIASARCDRGEANARLLAPDGTLIRRLCLGDGIAHLQCDPTGGIWVGYFRRGRVRDWPGRGIGCPRRSGPRALRRPGPLDLVAQRILPGRAIHLSMTATRSMLAGPALGRPTTARHRSSQFSTPLWPEPKGTG